MQKVQGKVRVATCEVQKKHILTIIFKVFRCWHIFSTALTFCMLDNPFHAFDVVGCFFFFFSKLTFSKHIFQEHYQSTRQTIWIQIRTDVLSVLKWAQNVCKGYKQTAKVAISRQNVNVSIM